MSRISDVYKLAAARHMLVNSNQTFRALIADRDENSGTTMFIISVPLATTRHGLFGSLRQLFRGDDGSNTKFGRCFLETFSSMSGVECHFDIDTPHIVTLYVEGSVMAKPSPSNFGSRFHGLPDPICVVVQATILRNRGPVQYCAEYLRRLF